MLSKLLSSFVSWVGGFFIKPAFKLQGVHSIQRGMFVFTHVPGSNKISWLLAISSTLREEVAGHLYPFVYCFTSGEGFKPKYPLLPGARYLVDIGVISNTSPIASASNALSYFIPGIVVPNWILEILTKWCNKNKDNLPPTIFMHPTFALKHSPFPYISPMAQLLF